MGDLLEGHGVREERGVFRQLREAGVDGACVAMFEQDHQRLHDLMHDAGGSGWEMAAHEWSW